ncbi:MAG: hypothetical protein KDD89_16585, partial [Anaerolineales bacterium]|nr:hypothetical protein [Anaerolineales bacterium]
MGWAHDSSGASILYRPRSPLGDLTRSQYPIRKYLVPGAEARGLPTVISPAPTPRWLPTPAVTPPISPTTSSDVSAPLVHTVPDNQLTSDTPWEIGWLSFLMLPAFMAVISAKRWRQLFESKIVRGLLVIGAVYFILTVCVYPFTPMAEISRSNELDEVRGGDGSLVVSAERKICCATISPNGTWLIWGDTDGDSFLHNLHTNQTRPIS